MTALLFRLLKVRPGEVAALVWSAVYFFCLLAAYYLLRPLREAFAAESGQQSLKWLYLATLVGMLVASLAFAAITTRLSRRRFIPYAYRFFSLNLVVFFALFHLLPEAHELALGRAYFVWLSVFNLFVVSVFWSFMADVFTNAQGRRLFAFIAVGGTFGQIAGSSAAGWFAARELQLTAPLASVVLLEIACLCVARLNAITGAPARTAAPSPAPLGGDALAGLRRLVQSPYLLGIALFMLGYTMTSTVLYFTKVAIGAREFADQEARVAFFAGVDFWTGVATVLAQMFLTSRLIARFGVGVTLGVLPVVTLLGFALLGFGFPWPRMLLGLASLGVGLPWPPLLDVTVIVIAFEALRRASNYAVSRPAREILYTVVPRQDKYKAKNAIDTFVYRAGDQAAAWTYSGLLLVPLLGAAGICFLTVPFAAAWLGVGLWLGRRQQELAAAAPDAAVSPSPPAAPGSR